MMRTAAIFLTLVIGALAVAHADDFGPRRGVREVRAAIPVLMEKSARWYGHTAVAIRVEDVVVVGDAAVATWSSGTFEGLTILDYRLARWWVRKNHELQLCDDDRGDLKLSAGLAAAVSAHMMLVRRHCDDIADLFWPPIWGNISGADGYIGWLAPPGSINDGPQKDSQFYSRAPTDAEMAQPGADALYFFSRNVGGSQILRFPEHTTLDVWCPFVLDPDVRYSLAITGGDTIVGPIDGTMMYNIMYFDLPAFTAKPGADLQGEIDWLRKPRTN